MMVDSIGLKVSISLTMVNYMVSQMHCSIKQLSLHVPVYMLHVEVLQH